MATVLSAAGALLSDAQRDSLQKILDAAAAQLTLQQLESYRQLLDRGSSMQNNPRDVLLGEQQ